LDKIKQAIELHRSSKKSQPDKTDGDHSEGDVLAEVEIYISYRQYSRARKLLDEAIEQEPLRLDLKLKLLELLFTDRDVKAYIELFQKTRKEIDPEINREAWEKATNMGSQLAPDHPLFSDEPIPLLERDPEPEDLVQLLDAAISDNKFPERKKSPAKNTSLGTLDVGPIGNEKTGPVAKPATRKGQKNSLPPLTDSQFKIDADADRTVVIKSPQKLQFPRRQPSSNSKRVNSAPKRAVSRPSRLALYGAIGALLVLAVLAGTVWYNLSSDAESGQTNQSNPVTENQVTDATPQGTESLTGNQNGSSPTLAGAQNQAASVNDTAQTPLAQEISQLLAEAADLRNRLLLTTPEGSNAYETYQKVIELDPQNEEARLGILALADDYQTLALKSLEEGDLEKTINFVELGLTLAPAHEELLKLQKELN